MVKLFQGDCLELMKNIPDNSVDLLLTRSALCVKHKGRRNCKQDNEIK